jgi:co-chaperonin GroES (HSP10)
MSSFKRIVPLLNRIVVRRAEQQTKTASGIIVSKQESASHGVVIELGPLTAEGGAHVGEGGRTRAAA